MFGYNEMLLHLCVSSTLVNHGDKVFHYPPTASYSCLFKPHKGMSAGCSGIPAQRALQLHGCPNKTLGVGFFTGKEALASESSCNRKPACNKQGVISVSKCTTFPLPSLIYSLPWTANSWEISFQLNITPANFTHF